MEDLTPDPVAAAVPAAPPETPPGGPAPSSDAAAGAPSAVPAADKPAKAKASALVKGAQAYITELFARELPARLTYHSLRHTEAVVKECRALAPVAKLNDDDTESLLLAAWFHDAGYLDVYDGHEFRSMERAAAWLGEQGADAARVQLVQELIKATHRDEEPATELQQLLADAELRAEVMSSPDVAMPSPEEEIEAVLPADVLASLDEPIDGDEDEEPGAPDGAPRTGAGASHDRDGGTGAHAKGTTAGGSRQQTTGSHVRAPSTGSSQTNERRVASETPARSGTGGGIPTTPTSMTMRPRTTDAVPPSLAFDTRNEARADIRRPTTDAEPPQPPPRPSSWHPPPSIPSAAPPPADLRGPSVKPAPPATAAVVLGAFDARRFFAEAIARRATGALCFESEGVVRRIVMREGDLVAAASGGELESLVHFLAARGELSRDEAPRLAAKIPPYGRHAGAALVAHGWLRQDQLWQVLRAHAEWIAGAILRLTRGTAQLEPDPPGRLRGEPSVFGAATGAEIFVDLVRRSVSLEDALDRLGGEGSRVADGPNHGLLAECNLPAQDIELLHRARGGSIADLLARATDGEIVAVIHALSLLGVVEVVPAPDFGRQGRDARDGHDARDGRDGRDARGGAGGAADAEVAALDEEAIRGRVRARLELVEEGDYFSVLGVTRDATGYEIRRAFIELRRTFEPSRILTPRLVDLTEDVRKIIIVIEEAYEILRDNARRERYRRAIDARPE